MPPLLTCGIREHDSKCVAPELTRQRDLATFGTNYGSCCLDRSWGMSYRFRCTPLSPALPCEPMGEAVHKEAALSMPTVTSPPRSRWRKDLTSVFGLFALVDIVTPYAVRLVADLGIADLLVD